MATRACVRALFCTVVRREQTAFTSSFVKHPSLKLSRFVPILNTANLGFTRNYSTETGTESESVQKTYACKLQGLPYDATAEDIDSFLGDIKATNIERLSDRFGRFNGVVIVSLQSQEDVESVMMKQGLNIGRRYVDVRQYDLDYQSGKQPRQQTRQSSEPSETSRSYEVEDDVQASMSVKCRGLPWRVSRQEIDKFFEGIELKDVFYLYNNRGLFSGTIFVDFHSEEDKAKAMGLTGNFIGPRHIDVMPIGEMNKRAASVPELSPVVKMLNLPYECSRREIRYFFKGLDILPEGISMPLDFQQRPSGIAIVRFETPEMAEEATKRSGESIGYRPISVNRWTQATRTAPRTSRSARTESSQPSD